MSGFASTPYNVAVGGTDFYYSRLRHSAALNTQLGPTGTPHASNTPVRRISQGVIPEQPWNDSQYGFDIFNILTESGGTAPLAGGGGGSKRLRNAKLESSLRALPQALLANGRRRPRRHVPATFPTSPSLPPMDQTAAIYPICAGDGDCQPASAGNTVQITGVGGTSASSPAFAGIMALVNQKYGRQGQANFVLYPLATQFPAAFHDVTVGTNSVPWRSRPHPPIASQSPMPPSSTTPPTAWRSKARSGPAQRPVQRDGRIRPGHRPRQRRRQCSGHRLEQGHFHLEQCHPHAVVDLLHPRNSDHCQRRRHPSTPTGNVALMTDSTEPVQQGQTWFTLTNGTFSDSVNYLPGGTYNIWGHYGGDPTNAASNSQKTQVTVSPETSGIYFNLFSPAGTSNSGSIVSGATIDYGTQLLLSAQVAPSSQLTAFENCFVNNTTCPILRHQPARSPSPIMALPSTPLFSTPRVTRNTTPHFPLVHTPWSPNTLVITATTARPLRLSLSP